jgi:hypothetical protein
MKKHMSERQPPSEPHAQVRGLLWIALLMLAVVLVRAARHHMLGPAWWRLW